MENKTKKNSPVYSVIIFGFRCVAWLMRQRPHLIGMKYLKKVPLPVIFTVTHDSYFEIPSLSKVYYSLKPRPVFTVMAKADFMSGRYLSTNFGSKNAFARFLLYLVDKTGFPKLVLKGLNVTTIHRPFIESFEKKRDEVKNEISNQLTYFKDKISEGFSTLLFPEGTSWGYGGLKKIRSAVYQLVNNTFTQYKTRIYILPINIKVDKLVKGWKDVFINVGAPKFVMKPKREEFNQYIFKTLQKLHTITFSQIAAYYLKRLSSLGERTHARVTLSRESLVTQLDKAVRNIQSKVNKKILPFIDGRLTEKSYLDMKVARFLSYCVKKKYLDENINNDNEKIYFLNMDMILADYPRKLFRKLNPLAYHANELISLGEKTIEPLFDIPVPDKSV